MIAARVPTLCSCRDFLDATGAVPAATPRDRWRWKCRKVIVTPEAAPAGGECPPGRPLRPIQSSADTSSDRHRHGARPAPLLSKGPSTGARADRPPTSTVLRGPCSGAGASRSPRSAASAAMGVPGGNPRPVAPPRPIETFDLRTRAAPRKTQGFSGRSRLRTSASDGLAQETSRAPGPPVATSRRTRARRPWEPSTAPGQPSPPSRLSLRDRASQPRSANGTSTERPKRPAAPTAGGIGPSVGVAAGRPSLGIEPAPSRALARRLRAHSGPLGPIPMRIGRRPGRSPLGGRGHEDRPAAGTARGECRLEGFQERRSVFPH